MGSAGHSIQSVADLRRLVPCKRYRILLAPSPRPAIADEMGRVRAIASQTATMIKERSFKDRDSVSILLPDRTRPLVSKLLLRELVKRLSILGYERIYLVIAYGNHEKHGIKPLGLDRTILSRVRVVHHDSRDRAALSSLAYTTKARERFKKFILRRPPKVEGFVSVHDFIKVKKEFLARSGKALYVNREFLSSSLRIVLSDIKPHQIFGYSGGSKMILPGIADENTIIANHLMRVHPSSRLGNATNNLPRVESTEIASLIPGTLFINTFSTERDKVVFFDLAWGPGGWSDFISRVKIYFEARTRRYPTVICMGRPPIDLNIYQLTKAVTPAAMTVAKNGRIVIIAHIKEGLGNIKALNERIYKLTIKKELPGSDNKIYLVSNLKREDVAKTFFIPLDLQGLRKLLAGEKGQILVIPDGDLIVPVTR